MQSTSRAAKRPHTDMQPTVENQLRGSGQTFGSTPYSDEEVDRLHTALAKKMPPEFIASRPGPFGRSIHYVEGNKVVALANDVLGFSGWSSSIVDTTVDFIDIDDSNRVTLGISSIVRVTLKNGAYHEDVGYGIAERVNGKGAAFEKAKKEAVTDATKRALRNLGNVLGGCLYDKEFLNSLSRYKREQMRNNGKFQNNQQGKTDLTSNDFYNTEVNGLTAKQQFDQAGIPEELEAMTANAQPEPPLAQQQQQQKRSVQPARGHASDIRMATTTGSSVTPVVAPKSSLVEIKPVTVEPALATAVRPESISHIFSEVDMEEDILCAVENVMVNVETVNPQPPQPPQHHQLQHQQPTTNVNILPQNTLQKNPTPAHATVENNENKPNPDPSKISRVPTNGPNHQQQQQFIEQDKTGQYVSPMAKVPSAGKVNGNDMAEGEDGLTERQRRAKRLQAEERERYRTLYNKQI